MTTFVLIHGAWHGGWCWRKVTPLLRAAGHEVFTPTLTGLGERVHLLTPDVGLDTHITDVVNVLEYEDLREVVLVGHSYGGMVITGVADRLADRLAHLVYFDAAVPRHREALLAPFSEASRSSLEERVRTKGDGWKLPFSEHYLNEWQITDPKDRAWLLRHLVPHPFKSFQDTVGFSESKIATIPRTYIWCSEPRGETQRPTAERVNTETGWRFRELATGHDAMVTMPRELADLLLDVV
jgi:pimeloyl-ACP methyl ester carboxylesterase